MPLSPAMPALKTTQNMTCYIVGKDSKEVMFACIRYMHAKTLHVCPSLQNKA